MTVSKIFQADLTVLLPFAEQVFHDAFYDHNSVENYLSYVNQAFTEQQFLIEIENPASHFFWILEDAKPKAWMKINEIGAFTEQIAGNAIEIQRIYVEANRQGKGYGKTLLDFTEKIALQKKVEFIWLGVWEHNLSAIKFYEKNGYSITSSHQFLFGEEVQTDYIMKKSIQ